jgi:hypothetical protein
MTMRTTRTMRAKALRTDKFTYIDSGCMIVVTHEIESNPPHSHELERSSKWLQWLLYILYHGRTMSLHLRSTSSHISCWPKATVQTLRVRVGVLIYTALSFKSRPLMLTVYLNDRSRPDTLRLLNSHL